MDTHGTYDDRFQKVKDLFDDLHKSDREIGSSFAVYKDGKSLVEIHLLLFGLLPKALLH